MATRSRCAYTCLHILGIRRAFPPDRPALSSYSPGEECFMVNMNRRQFFKVTGTTLAGSSLALLG